MIIAAAFSKPSARCGAEFGKDYVRVKIKASSSAGGSLYAAEFFTKTQVFHKKFDAHELDSFIEKHAGTSFKNCVIRTNSEEITILANKRGEITRLCKPLQVQNAAGAPEVRISRHAGTALAAAKNAAASCPLPVVHCASRTKNHILPEGAPVPFLVLLGIMTTEGKVIASKYAKFRQINRFLEFVDDITPRLLAEIPVSKERPLRIADFGCGKSYLTFAVHHFFTQIKKVETEIVGLDLKQDVIDVCTRTAERLGCAGLQFAAGNIETYRFDAPPDMVITLHACDTATDFELAYAVKNSCAAVLSVPCCHHELNAQLSYSAAHKNDSAPPESNIFSSLLKYGIIKERFASLVTDALRARYLESAGYSVQVLEFIDMEHTPKNILIRAVKNGVQNSNTEKRKRSLRSADALTDALGAEITLKRLIEM